MCFDSCSNWRLTYHLCLVCQALHKDMIAGAGHGFVASLEQEVTTLCPVNETRRSSILNAQHEPPERIEFVLIW